MEALIKPKKLQIGDTVATISLSGGAAGDLPDWYNVAKGRLNKLFGLNVVETSHSLKGRKYIYENPQACADDLMEALADSRHQRNLPERRRRRCHSDSSIC